MAHIASAGGWDTSLTLVNLGRGARRSAVEFLRPGRKRAATAVHLSAAALARHDPRSDLRPDSQRQRHAHSGYYRPESDARGGLLAIADQRPVSAASPSSRTHRAGKRRWFLWRRATRALTCWRSITRSPSRPDWRSPTWPNSAANVNVVIRDDTGAQIGTARSLCLAEGHNLLYADGRDPVDSR